MPALCGPVRLISSRAQYTTALAPCPASLPGCMHVTIRHVRLVEEPDVAVHLAGVPHEAAPPPLGAGPVVAED